MVQPSTRQGKIYTRPPLLCLVSYRWRGIRGENLVSRSKRLRTRFKTSRYHRVLTRASLYSAIGVINTLVDYGVFFAVRMGLSLSTATMAIFAILAHFTHMATAETVLLVISNVIAWLVAVTGSYVMNSMITFGAESGRRLRWRDYTSFLLSGIAAVITNTVTLIVAAQILLLPVWLAKAAASCASVLLNFSLLNFVVFRPPTGSVSNTER
jgi:putative flippase GtrA